MTPERRAWVSATLDRVAGTEGPGDTLADLDTLLGELREGLDGLVRGMNAAEGFPASFAIVYDLFNLAVAAHATVGQLIADAPGGSPT